MFRLFITVISLFAAIFGMAGQAMYFDSARMGTAKSQTADTTSNIAAIIRETRPDSVRTVEEIDAYLDSLDTQAYDTVMVMKPLPDFFFSPAVFHRYIYADTVSPFTPD
ncbi:MAG: hypothetical protein K2K22_04260, partial [Muribaculaceae bacterium]|nr:hypothetical protein [Muribaculaceae bacterium]